MADNGVEVELVPKDPDSISNSQKLAEVAKQAPELMSLCMDLKESLTEFRQKIGPLVKEVCFKLEDGFGHCFRVWGCVSGAI